MLYLRGFGFGLIGGLIGAVPDLVVMPHAEGQAGLIFLLLCPLIVVSSGVGLLLGKRVSPSTARSWGALPGAMLGVCTLPLFFKEGGWYLPTLAPALASGASSYVLALARQPKDIA